MDGATRSSQWPPARQTATAFFDISRCPPVAPAIRIKPQSIACELFNKLTK